MTYLMLSVLALTITVTFVTLKLWRLEDQYKDLLEITRSMNQQIKSIRIATRK